jgi:hypothetical protein
MDEFACYSQIGMNRRAYKGEGTRSCKGGVILRESQGSVKLRTPEYSCPQTQQSPTLARGALLWGRDCGRGGPGFSPSCATNIQGGPSFACFSRRVGCRAASAVAFDASRRRPRAQPLRNRRGTTPLSTDSSLFHSSPPRKSQFV